MPVEIVVGDCREQLRLMEAASIHACVTSPPYFGLRDYDHAGQIGLEDTPEAFVAQMVAVFREVRRVLRDDGTLWLNMGDSYAGSGRGGYAGGKSTLGGSTEGQDISRVARGSQKAAGLHERSVEAGAIARAWVPAPKGLKQKDLIGIPWRVAFALQADGWYLRQDIIWSKPNPMPESVTDRCTKSHEYLFLLSKSPRYYFDAKAIAEPAGAKNEHDMTGQGYAAPGQSPQTGTRRTVGSAGPPRSARDSFKREGSKRGIAGPNQSVGTHRPDRRESDYDLNTRNKRSVWTVATLPFKEAHFATFPPALIKDCILAGSPPGGTVLDPFGGAGTTGLVAARLGRDAVLIELNPKYAAIAQRRLKADMTQVRGADESAGLEPLPLFAEAAE